MTPYIAFKRALIDGCLTCPVTRIAEMIMIDVGLPHQKIVSNWPDYDAINKFIISMNMPRMYGKEMVSVYLASFVKEKHSYERTKDSRVRRLRMRSLSKAHDWNTVK